MDKRSFRLVLMAAALFASGAAHAQNVTAGKEIAQATCSSCHVVDPQGQKTGSDAVPTFASIAQMPSTTARSIAAFLSTPHARMPDLILNQAEIEDVSAYILSLRNAP